MGSQMSNAKIICSVSDHDSDDLDNDDHIPIKRVRSKSVPRKNSASVSMKSSKHQIRKQLLTQIHTQEELDIELVNEGKSLVCNEYLSALPQFHLNSKKKLPDQKKN